MKTTAVAPSNIAFIKYWGRKNEDLRLPSNASISMNLDNLLTTTTVEFADDYNADILKINNQDVTNEGFEKVTKHLDRVRKLANINLHAKVVSNNSFPAGTGLSSSASGFAALTLAATAAAGLKLSQKELSILARQGSGSACRSIPNGFVEWLDGDTSETSYAESLYPENYWNLTDIVAVLTREVKEVATTEGHKLATASAFFETRQDNINHKISEIKTALAKKDFTLFGEITEAEALELHAIMITTIPSLIYWHPTTITLMKAVKRLRAEGIEAYFTINTGANVHVICETKNADKVSKIISETKGVEQIIVNKPSKGASLISNHLF